MRALPVILAASVASGVVGLTASPVSAYPQAFSADCNGVTIHVLGYERDDTNRWSITVGGQTFDGTFGFAAYESAPVPQNGQTTTWSAYVEAEDGTRRQSGGGTVGPCGTPPRPNDVVRVEKGQLTGCDVKVRGIRYGAGRLTWDEVFHDTWRFDKPSNSWVVVEDRSPEIERLLFTPWTTQQQIQLGCIDAPGEPAPIIERDRSVQVDCSSRSRVVTIRTTITRYVYNERQNRWVLGDPVTTTRTVNNPLQAGDCGTVGGTQGGNPGVPSAPTPGGATPANAPGTGPVAAPTVGGAQSGAPTNAAGKGNAGDGASVPGAVDSGLAGSRAMLTVGAADTVLESAARNLGAGLLLVGGLLLGFVPGRRRVATKHRA